MTEPLVVVISGQVSAGKTTAGEMLRGRGFQYARISQAIKTRWSGPDSAQPPRSWYQEMGMELHRTIGQRALCAETVNFIPETNDAFVIDGARWKEDVAYFRDRFGERVVHIHLTASTETRRTRFEAREKDVTFDEADHHEVEQEIPQLAPIADVVFDNSLSDKGRLESFLTSVLEKQRRAS